MFLNKNEFWVGIVIGLVLPFVGYALLLTVYDSLDAAGIIKRMANSPTFRQRTLMVIAICLNLIPFNIYQRRNYTQTMRGIILPTGLYVIAWIIYFGRYIL